MLSLAQRCPIVGRMLQVQPTSEVLDAFVSALPEFGPVDVEAIGQDYLRLFVGLGTPLAPPWESAWASDARLLFQRETLDVRYWYRSAGLEIAALHHEPDDHIGLELEYVGLMLERADAESAAAFTRAHPLAWAKRWCQAVRENANDRFYPALAGEAVRLFDEVGRCA
jgi:TorA maturation chaperone TorD